MLANFFETIYPNGIDPIKKEAVMKTAIKIMEFYNKRNLHELHELHKISAPAFVLFVAVDLTVFVGV